jgi:hypothetical protein
MSRFNVDAHAAGVRARAQALARLINEIFACATSARACAPGCGPGLHRPPSTGAGQA